LFLAGTDHHPLIGGFVDVFSRNNQEKKTLTQATERWIFCSFVKKKERDMTAREKKEIPIGCIFGNIKVEIPKTCKIICHKNWTDCPAVKRKEKKES
jgi:hypothetical protein